MFLADVKDYDVVKDCYKGGGSLQGTWDLYHLGLYRSRLAPEIMPRKLLEASGNSGALA